MKITGEVEIDFVHREYLGVSAAGCSALHAEAWAERRFAQGNNSVLSYFIESQGKTDRYCSFTDTRFGGCNGSYQDKVTLLYFLLVNQLFGNLCDIATIIFYFLAGDSDTFSNLLYFCLLYTSPSPRD